MEQKGLLNFMPYGYGAKYGKFQIPCEMVNRSTVYTEATELASEVKTRLLSWPKDPWKTLSIVVYTGGHTCTVMPPGLTKTSHFIIVHSQFLILEWQNLHNWVDSVKFIARATIPDILPFLQTKPDVGNKRQFTVKYDTQKFSRSYRFDYWIKEAKHLMIELPK